MAKSRRLQLHKELKLLLGSDHVYFQPPESVKLEYPCIVYNHLRNATFYADNLTYSAIRGYELTLIAKDPDTELVDKLTFGFPMIQFNRHFSANNLNHDVFILYY